MRKRITHYTTLTRFGTRPIVSVAEVMADLGLENRRQLPETWGRFWAVREVGK
ncbi:MAG: hypothetical protein K2Q27_05335 [Novosphingobium sp.]|nr:hypothetical protein [Novosphingobium sp.]